MQGKEIENRAKDLEKTLDGGNPDRLAAQLHEMPPAERAAIAKQIQNDQQQKIAADPLLPQLQFSDKGDLLSYRPMGANDQPHTEVNYDQNTGKRMEDIVKVYGEHGTSDFTRTTYDATGKAISKSEDTQSRTAGFHHTELDSNAKPTKSQGTSKS